MKTVEIVGWKRELKTKAYLNELRDEGNVPCVLYSKNVLVHFYAPMILFRDLVYTPNAHFVELNIEGQTYSAILQDIQFHPVSEVILHADFMELVEKTPVVLDIPVSFEGNAPGVAMGGKMFAKLRKLKVKATPSKMPDTIVVNVSKLKLGKSIKVGEIPSADYSILNNASVPVVSVEIPRALKGKGAMIAEDEEESEEAAAEQPAAE